MEMIIAGTLHRWRKVIAFNYMLGVIENNQVDQSFCEFGKVQNCIQLVALTDALLTICRLHYTTHKAGTGSESC
jgi:hypothetical protein